MSRSLLPFGCDVLFGVDCYWRRGICEVIIDLDNFRSCRGKHGRSSVESSKYDLFYWSPACQDVKIPPKNNIVRVKRGDVS